MKFLFDQNISYRILKKILNSFPDSKHVNEVKLTNSDDKAIWHYAKKEGFTIITHNSDFDDLFLLYGFPPKIIKFKVGNLSNDETIAIILKNEKSVREFIEDEETGFLEIE